VTCRQHAINPYDYLVDVLQRIDRHQAAEVHLLTPRLWKQHFAANPLRSPLQTLRGKASTSSSYRLLFPFARATRHQARSRSSRVGESIA